MAVDLSELVESIKREVSPPGNDLLPDATDDMYLGYLQDSFWEAKLYGFFSNYTEADGDVSPISGSTDLGRDEQQLIVLFGGVRIIRNYIMSKDTTFRAKAGSVEFETQSSATVFAQILRDIQKKIDILLVNLTDFGTVTDQYLDSLSGRDISLMFGDVQYWGAGGNPNVSSPYYTGPSDPQAW